MSDDRTPEKRANRQFGAYLFGCVVGFICGLIIGMQL